MPFPVHAITLDLDDTIWPIAPTIDRAEAALDAWLLAHAPRAASRWPLHARRALRDEVDAEHPQYSHDFTRQRLITLEHMLRDSGEDTALVGAAFEAYFAARCEVEHYDDSVEALQRLAARVPLAALSNGNACLKRIGLMHLFGFQLGAREHGAASHCCTDGGCRRRQASRPVRSTRCSGRGCDPGAAAKPCGSVMRRSATGWSGVRRASRQARSHARRRPCPSSC